MNVKEEGLREKEADRLLFNDLTYYKVNAYRRIIMLQI